MGGVREVGTGSDVRGDALAAVERSSAGGSNRVLLTRVGGGAFGNADEWIDDGIMRALSIVEQARLDIRLVSHWTHS